MGPLYAPFGADNRAALLDQYFEGSGPTRANEAWKDVYRLLLWTDPTTGLAHCYESDKAQPGRPWYARSLAFHGWLASELKTTPSGLRDELDGLFRRVTEQLASVAASQQATRAAKVASQRAPYDGQKFPLPGEDPELEALILGELEPWLSDQPPPEVLAHLAQRIHLYLSTEDKRRNLVGEGFEDTLAAVIRRLPGGNKLDIRKRALLHTLPGFRAPPGTEKPRIVDLAILGSSHRTIVTAKWSVRADREEQFGVDFDAYARLEDAGEGFDFVLATNEFDAARLDAACLRRVQSHLLFSQVVHVNPVGVVAAYAGEGRGAARGLADHIKSGRLTSLGTWLSDLTT